MIAGMLRTVCLASLVLSFAIPAAAQGPAAGVLLVARPALDDPNFAESVVLVIYHDSNGSLGILLNRPTNLRPSRVFSDVEALAGYSDPVFFGGPLEPRQVLVLLRDPPPGTVPGDPLIEDVYVTADVKYHEFFDAEGRMVIADIGHYESEQYTVDLLRDLLLQKFPTFAVLKTGVNTNPVQYFT